MSMLRFIQVRPSWTAVLVLTTVAVMALTLWLIFAWVPTDANQGAVQRIFYFHVPLAWVCMGAIFFVAVASILHLVRGREVYDRLAQSFAEVGVVFGTLMLTTGIIWARPVWGQWWTNEAKLTTALILYIIYIAYLVFRAFTPKGDANKRLSAVIAVVGAAFSPIIYFSSLLWENVAHPAPVLGPLTDEASAGLPNEFRVVLYTSLAAFVLLFMLMVRVRYLLRRSEDIAGDVSRKLDLADLPKARS